MKTKILQLVIAGVRRAFSRDGGGLVTVRNQTNEFDAIAYAAIGVRLVAFAGVVAIAQYFGLDIATLWNIFNQAGANALPAPDALP